MKRRRTLVICLLLAFVFAPPRASGATDQEIEYAIEKGKAFLYHRQYSTGTWEEASAPQQSRGGFGGRGGGSARGSTDGAQWGGLTAIATYALLSAGDRPVDEKLTRAIAFLKTAHLVGTYALAMRCQVWSVLTQSPDTRRHAYADASDLVAAMVTQGEGRGFYNYGTDQLSFPVPQFWFDLSNGQMGVLGVWAADRACYPNGAMVPLGYWQVVDKAWRDAQLPSGAWPYTTRGEGEQTNARLSMTAAGVATLYITQDYLQREAGLQCQGYFSDSAIDAGMDFISEHFDDLTGSPVADCYTLYGMERIGAASGRRYFKNLDWFKQGVDYLLKHQNPDGSWGVIDAGVGFRGQGFSHNPLQIPDTCFALLFLSRGRAPVAITKLDYGEASQWDQRPRDVANVTQWLSNQTEMDLNWQTLTLDNPIDDLHDSPILYIAGAKPLNFSPDQEGKLRQYVEEGGLIVANADCASTTFAASFEALGRRLFPAYQFRTLPAGNLLQTGELFKPKPGREIITLRGMSNGVRELMLLIPTDDVAQNWQRQAVQQRPEQFQMMENILVYATDKFAGLRRKGLNEFPRPDPKITAKTRVKIARLYFNGNWNPEPAGWRRLTADLHNRRGVDLSGAAVNPDTTAIDPSFALADLTGTGDFTLSPAAAKAITDYVNGGGTLVIDAAGGDGAFATAAEKAIAQLFPGADMTPPPWLQSLGPIGYRSFARTVVGSSDAARLRAISINGRLAVYYSPADMSAGLTGQEIDGIRGYDPKSSAVLFERIIESAPPKAFAQLSSRSASSPSDSLPPPVPATHPGP